MQHSVTAADGDSEGTPVVILEAGAAGLPQSCRRGMPASPRSSSRGEPACSLMRAEPMRWPSTCSRSPTIPAWPMNNRPSHVRRHYTMTRSINRLARVLEAVASGAPIAPVRDTIEADFLRTEPIASHPTELFLSGAQ